VYCSLLMYKSIPYFSVLNLYPATLLNLFISTSIFYLHTCVCVCFLGFAICGIMSSENQCTFTLSFLIWILSEFFCFLFLAKFPCPGLPVQYWTVGMREDYFTHLYFNIPPKVMDFAENFPYSLIHKLMPVIQQCSTFLRLDFFGQICYIENAYLWREGSGGMGRNGSNSVCIYE
jgi:hypothetical protein